MLNIMYEGETPKDHISPINVANALIESGIFGEIELEEIADHLNAYLKRFRSEQKRAGIDI